MSTPRRYCAAGSWGNSGPLSDYLRSACRFRGPVGSGPPGSSGRISARLNGSDADCSSGGKRHRCHQGPLPLHLTAVPHSRSVTRRPFSRSGGSGRPTGRVLTKGLVQPSDEGRRAAGGVLPDPGLNGRWTQRSGASRRVVAAAAAVTMDSEPWWPYLVSYAASTPT
jgi:hypothetical protein